MHETVIFVIGVAIGFLNGLCWTYVRIKSTSSTDSSRRR